MDSVEWAGSLFKSPPKTNLDHSRRSAIKCLRTMGKECSLLHNITVRQTNGAKDCDRRGRSGRGRRTCVGNTRYLARPPCNYIIAQSRGGRTNEPTSLSISLLQFSPPRDSFSPLLHFILRWTDGRTDLAFNFHRNSLPFEL